MSPFALDPDEMPEAIPFLRQFMERPTVDTHKREAAERLQAYQARQRRIERRYGLVFLAILATAFLGAGYALAIVKGWL